MDIKDNLFIVSKAGKGFSIITAYITKIQDGYITTSCGSTFTQEKLSWKSVWCNTVPWLTKYAFITMQDAQKFVSVRTEV